jgi:NAD(P)-dependent dehydrogenase (short-subunit alcohol dehydrogenase family)
MASGDITGFWPSGCFADRHVLISGGISGIGAAIGRAFLAENARVTVTGVGEADVAAAERELEGATVRQLDVRDEQAIAELVAGFDRLDHLVNCAGIIRRGDEFRPDVFADVIDINLTGTMRLSTAARPLLARQGGTIVNTASMLSFFGGGLVPAYAASKGGIAQLTKSLAIAWAPDNIRVNAIAPGWIETALTKAIRDDEARHRAITERTALKRWGKPDELAGAVLFLCSPLASYITGTVLPVDGGYLAV